MCSEKKGTLKRDGFYTGDSLICRAGLQQGFITNEKGGNIDLILTGARNRFD